MSSAGTTSWSLVRRAAAGNPAGREAFVSRYSGVVRTYFAARWRLPADHERIADACQELFFDCFKSNGALSRVTPDGPGGFKAFLMGVARLVAASMERKIARRRDPADGAVQLDQLPGNEDSLSSAFDRAWARMIINEAYESMALHAKGNPGAIRRYEVLRLKYHDNLETAAIAERLDVTHQQVYELVRQAKNAFRAYFLDVMASYNPNANQSELKRRCIELLEGL